MNKKSKGSALIAVLTITSILLLAAMATSINAISDMNTTNEERIRTELQYACESGLNRAKAKIEKYYNNDTLSNLTPIVNFQTPASGSGSDDTEVLPADKKFADETFVQTSNTDYYTFNYNISGTGNGSKTVYVKYAIIKDPALTTADDPDGDGWTVPTTDHVKCPLLIEAVAYSPNIGWVGMQQKASPKRSALFMYNIFFQDELEIAPGPNFNLTGLIHTNKNMYLNSENTMKIYTNSMTSAGEIFRGRLNNSNVNGTVQITSGSQTGTLKTMTTSPKLDASNSNWSSLATSTWQRTVRDKHLGATTLSAPKLQSFEPGGYYNQKAQEQGLCIKYLSTPKTYDIYWKDPSTGVVNHWTGNDAKTRFVDTGIIKETTMYDRREFTNKQVKVTQIDMSKLAGNLTDSRGNTYTGTNYYPDSGLIYMTRDDAVADTDGNLYSPSSSRVVSGFKLVNGSVLSKASTLITDDTLYIKGDFNLHTSTDSAADSWKPSAVVADAVNILSNAWTDANSSSKQTASNTTVNSVLITGNVPTKANSTYSGGLENFPRLLENWDGKTLTMTGGFMQLFRSKFSTNNWSNVDYYNPPARNWSAESRFSNLNDFPPMFTNLFPSICQGVIISNMSRISNSPTESYIAASGGSS